MPKPTPPQQALISLKEQYDRVRYPSMPDYARPKPKFDWSSANGITKAIVQYIELSGGWATRISTEGRYIESLGHRIPSSVKRGTPDVIGVLRGVPLFIEVKYGRDVMSDVQEEVMKDIIRAGGRYFVARDFDSFYEWVVDK